MIVSGIMRECLLCSHSHQSNHRARLATSRAWNETWAKLCMLCLAVFCPAPALALASRRLELARRLETGCPPHSQQSELCGKERAVTSEP